MENISIVIRIRILVISILVFTILPLTILCFVPIYILRYLTSLLKRIFRPDLGKLLNARSCIFATDDLWTKPVSTLVVFGTLEGQLGIEDLRTNFRKQVLQGQGNGINSTTHPELLQFPSTWMGFPVWVPEANFSLDEHVKPYDGPEPLDLLTESVCLDIAHELVKRPFMHGKSPWEMFVLQNFIGDPNPEIPKSAVVLRIHHCLADGFSLAQFFATIGNMVTFVPVTNYPKRTFFTTCLHLMTFVLRVPYDFASTIVLHSDSYGPWHLPTSELAKEYASSVTPKIPMTYIKTIRDFHKVTTTGIIMTVIAGTLRRIMMESGKGVPQSITMVAPLPAPAHPDRMRNHMTAVIFSLPIGIEDSVERLRIIERSMKCLRKSTVPVLSFIFLKLSGALYPCMTRFLSRSRTISIGFSNFPGPTTQTRFLDFPVLDTLFIGGMLIPGIGVTSISSNGNLRMTLGINDAILPDGEFYLKRYTDYILREFDDLMIRGGGI